jgi:hypothetical protein
MEKALEDPVRVWLWKSPEKKIGMDQDPTPAMPAVRKDTGSLNAQIPTGTKDQGGMTIMIEEGKMKEVKADHLFNLIVVDRGTSHRQNHQQYQSLDHHPNHLVEGQRNRRKNIRKRTRKTSQRTGRRKRKVVLRTQNIRKEDPAVLHQDHLQEAVDQVRVLVSQGKMTVDLH